MSMLASTDPKEAERFYGEVFGWETDDFDGVGCGASPGSSAASRCNPCRAT